MTERTNGLVSPAQTDTCDHVVLDPITNLPSKVSDWGYLHCPKCGVKL